MLNNNTLGSCSNPYMYNVHNMYIMYQFTMRYNFKSTFVGPRNLRFVLIYQSREFNIKSCRVLKVFLTQYVLEKAIELQNNRWEFTVFNRSRVYWSISETHSVHFDLLGPRTWIYDNFECESIVNNAVITLSKNLYHGIVMRRNTRIVYRFSSNPFERPFEIKHYYAVT